MNDPSENGAAAHDAAFVMNGDGIVIAWSADASSIFGWSENEALGRSLSSLIIKPEERSMHEAGLKRFMAGAAGKFLNRPLELNVIDRHGNSMIVAFLISYQKDAGGARFPTTARRVDS